MKQIAFVTMFYLPASFVAVRISTEMPYMSYAVVDATIGSVWHERTRNQPWDERNCGTLRSNCGLFYACHRLDYRRLSKQAPL
jgi:hypothetical protein